MHVDLWIVCITIVLWKNVTGLLKLLNHCRVGVEGGEGGGGKMEICVIQGLKVWTEIPAYSTAYKRALANAEMNYS